MCVPLVARVDVVDGDEAEVELLGTEGRARVHLSLFTDVAVGQHVLVDRGLVIELISAEEAESMLAFYAELAESWELLEVGDG